MYYKIKYLRDGNPHGRAYTFQSEDELAEGDIVDISEKQMGIVTSSMLEDTDKKWIETYGSDAVKTVKKHVEDEENGKSDD